MADPVCYLQQDVACTGQVAPFCAVIGPPQSGRSSLAKRLEVDMRMIRLTISKVLKKVIEMGGELGKSV